MSLIDELIVKMEHKAQVIISEIKRKRLENKLKDIKNAKEITNIMYINNYKQAKIYYKELEDKCSNEECKNETTIDLKTKKNPLIP